MKMVFKDSYHKTKGFPILLSQLHTFDNLWRGECAYKDVEQSDNQWRMLAWMTLVFRKILRFLFPAECYSSDQLLECSVLIKSDNPTYWSNLVIIKVDILLWKVTLNRIPINEYLTHKGINLDYVLFPLCELHTENEDHLFIIYFSIADIWRFIGR